MEPTFTHNFEQCILLGAKKLGQLRSNLMAITPHHFGHVFQQLQKRVLFKAFPVAPSYVAVWPFPYWSWIDLKPSDLKPRQRPIPHILRVVSWASFAPDPHFRTRQTKRLPLPEPSGDCRSILIQSNTLESSNVKIHLLLFLLALQLSNNCPDFCMHLLFAKPCGSYWY